MTDQNLQNRAGRNIGVESLPVFLIGAGSPEVVVPTTLAARDLLQAVPNALRTPYARQGENTGYIFNSSSVDTVGVGFYFNDGQGNEMLIAQVDVPPASAVPLPLSLFQDADPNPFNPSKPLSLCGAEKIVVKAQVM